MEYRASVTFENLTGAPVTLRTSVSAGQPSTAVSRAIRAFQAQHPGKRWTSLVVVLEKPSDEP